MLLCPVSSGGGNSPRYNRSVASVRLSVLRWQQENQPFVHDKTGALPVPDRRRRVVPEVVLVRRWAVGVLGIWKGEGLGKGLGQERSVYKQPETEVDGSCHS